MSTRESSQACLAATLVAAVVLVAPVSAQMPSYGIGRAPTSAEVSAWDIAIGPRGSELPPGRGSVASGRQVYVDKCAVCHGATGREGPQDILVGGQGTLATQQPLKTIGSYWPYATTIYDYVQRAMPFFAPGSLTPDEVYSVTAYLLFANGIIHENDALDAHTLPAVRMPNSLQFVRDPRPDAP